VESLLEQGADPSEENNLGSNAVIFAASGSRVDIMRALLEVGGKVDGKDGFGMTALMCAAYAGRGEIVAVLLDAGANVGARDYAGKTAVKYAEERGHMEIAEMLRGGGPAQKIGSEQDSTEAEWNAAQRQRLKKKAAGKRITIRRDGPMKPSP
jgi:ankyrin repeat protein